MKDENKKQIFMTLPELQAKAAGTPIPQPVNPSVTLVQNSTGCGIKSNPTPTQQSVPLDSGTLIGRACGYFEIDVDTTATAISTGLLWILGINANPENEAVIRRLYSNVPTNATVFDTETSVDGIPGDGTTFANFGLTDYLNQAIFGTHSVLIESITYKSEGSTANFAAVKATSWLAKGLHLEGNYENSKLNIAPDRCSPCFNSDDDVVEWKLGGLPISDTEALMFVLPDATDGVFRFCVGSVARVQNYVPCEGGNA